MAITASDLILFGSSQRPTSDTGSVGGGIDTRARPFTSPMSSAGPIELISSSSGDTRTATVVYRTTDAEVETWTPTLAGTCSILLSTGTPDHLISIALSSASTGLQAQVRYSSGPTIHVFAFGETNGFALFAHAHSFPSTEVKRYEKLFLKNVSTDADLSGALVQITSDASGQYAVGVSTAKNSTETWANRLTYPSSYSWSTGSSGVVVSDSTLGSSEAVAIAIEQTLAALTSGADPEFLLEISGYTLVSS